MTDKSLAIIQPSKLEVKQYAADLRDFLPGGQKMTEAEARTLAQIALTHHLDPFNREIWFLKRENGDPIGIHVGIFGHRRAAKNQMEREGGGNAWPVFERMSDAEMKASGYATSNVVYKCKLYDTHTVKMYVDNVSTMLKAGAPWEAVVRIFGEQPFTLGIGYAWPDEKSKLDICRRAMKRAEADAIKRRFCLPFGDETIANGDLARIEEIEQSDAIEGAVKIVELEKRAETRKQINGALFGEDDGDTGEIINVTPRPAAAPVPVEAEARPEAKKANGIVEGAPTSKMWATYYALEAEARGLGLELTPIRNETTNIELSLFGATLRQRIDAAKAEHLAQAEANGAE